MEPTELDLKAWDAVHDTLIVVADATRVDRQTRPFAASVLHRLATVQLRAAVLRESAALTEGLPGASADRLQTALFSQLRGRMHEYAVLEAIAAEDRAEAQRLVDEALSLDPGFVPALHAALALARVAARWPDAVAALHTLTEVDLRPTSRAKALETLADIHWQKLDKREAARGYYRAALDLEPLVAERLDKLLKLNLEMEDWDEAVACCHQLIGQVSGHAEKAPLAVTYRLTLGEIFVYGKSAPGVALRHFLHALQLMPEYDLTYTLLTELLSAHPWSTLSAQYAACDDTLAPPSPTQFAALEAAVGSHPTVEAVVGALRAGAAS